MNENDWGVLNAVEVALISVLEGGAVTPVLVDVTESLAGDNRATWIYYRKSIRTKLSTMYTCSLSQLIQLLLLILLHNYYASKLILAR